MRSKKLYTVKQWARFKKTLVKENQSIKHNVDIQELMCKNYDIILTDYMTLRERKIQMIKTFFEKVKSALREIKSALDKIHESNQKQKTPQKRTKKKKVDNILNDFTMNEKDYIALAGRSTADDLDTITANVLTRSLAPGLRADPDLAIVVESWPNLPQPVRKAILDLAKLER